jgi:hypothetical protein
MNGKLQLIHEEGAMNMSRKSFLIWGLAIIIIIPLATAAVRLLALSDIIPNDESLDFMNQASGAILLWRHYLFTI